MTALHEVTRGYETKMRIISAMVELGSNKTIDELTVSEICAHIAITRQTFYHHFIDKYDAMQWFNMQLCEDLLGAIGNGLTWGESGVRMLIKTVDNRDFYSFAMKGSGDLNSLTSQLDIMFYRSWKSTLEQLPGFVLTDRMDYQLRAWSRIGFMLVADWIEGGFAQTVEKVSDLIVSCIPHELKEATDGYVLQRRNV
ncbi:MAG: TetR family transcriptional regulator [Eggerthellaceae bacterium]|nr:TetR family transcriptional regulator [Eggerthellaceae bacterium]